MRASYGYDPLTNLAPRDYMQMNDAFIIIAMTGIGIGLLKAQKALMPRAYFYFGKLLEGYDNDVPPFGVVFRTSIPFFVGVLTGLLTLAGGTMRPENAGLLSGFLTSFLVVWPDIYSPELISYHYSHMKGKLFTLHVMFVGLFSVLGDLGGRFAVVIGQLLAKISKFTMPDWVDGKSIGNDLISNAIWVGSSLLLFGIFNFVRTSMIKRDENLRP